MKKRRLQSSGFTLVEMSLSLLVAAVGQMRKQLQRQQQLADVVREQREALKLQNGELRAELDDIYQQRRNYLGSGGGDDRLEGMFTTF